MTMKPTDLQKHMGLKIAGKMGAAGASGRFGASAAGVGDKKEQRDRDRALGLVPFACKLPASLVKQLQESGAEHEAGLHVLIKELLEAGLAGRKAV